MVGMLRAARAMRRCMVLWGVDVSGSVAFRETYRAAVAAWGRDAADTLVLIAISTY